MSRRRVTMADVARRAGVSPTTASFVLADRRDMRISGEAEERVRRAAQELGYRPNLTARGLRTSVTRTVAMISDTIATTQFAGEVIHGALDAAGARDHVLFIAETKGDPDVEAQLVEGMLDRQVDGFIYAAMSTREVRLPAALQDTRVVMLNCWAQGTRASSVLPDEVNAGRDAASVVLAAGHRQGVHVIGGRHITPATPEGVWAGQERMRGIEEAMAQAGTRLDGVAECDWQPADGHREVLRLLDAGTRPHALICLNDRVSMGAYQALQQAGLNVPDDVCVVSFDDSDLAAWLRPSLTSIALPHYDLGRTAVEVLLDGGIAPRVHRIPMPVTLRSSHRTTSGSPRPTVTPTTTRQGPGEGPP
ncbi:LacI family DNA-binding transcriptional regulator [Streptomyces sp. S.PB5]|uniref:LacI family DNA-binding transcriptional regulator n=1 Tax=Streptomyces sp. S.PB5 TaxID=3020844 RepID=UPI0025B0858F|nr:LacI family DNA-binding transcriptional regulator [Streptomyces sp. S.PB5]MDN3029306.1 LacI family DNA-binding transcriptional regulator [Streptomyces sp. S.PB5]